LRERKDGASALRYPVSSMSYLTLSHDTPVPEAMSSAPSIPGIFNSHRTHCVGCSLSRFCTLADVARIYGLSVDALLAELRQAALANPMQSIGERHEKSD
jgi:hybrid cluster-associated redox disulfide protein